MDQPDQQRGHRPLAFDKMEKLVQEMQDEKKGVDVRSQKLFLTSIPDAFTGTDVINWLSSRLTTDDSTEAMNLANQLCHYGYFFPITDWKNLVVNNDGSLYRFQVPYYWPTPSKYPDNLEYAVYLHKRVIRNKQKHGLEEYEMEALNSLKKNLANKWEVVEMQAQQQLKLTKDRKKGDKTITDSQERAFWRVYRPPPGYSTSLEPLPIRAGGSAAAKKRRSSHEIKKEVEFLKSCVERTRAKVSVALESLIQFSDTYTEYDPMVTVPIPPNPWISDDPNFWQLNSSRVEVPTEKRVKRWGLSMEELVSDETGLEEFTNYLRKEYSHENIRFWLAAKDLRGSSQSQILRKVKKIYDEFLAPGAPCEVNIDSKTMEKTQSELKNPSRFTFDSAAEHVYALLLKKDCYPRFIRSEHYKNLLANALQPTGKRKFDFFGFGAAQARAKLPIASKAAPSCTSQSQQNYPFSSSVTSNITKRRGSDRSLTESSHELSVPYKVAHSHSQSNIMDVANRDSNETTERWNPDEVCPWEAADLPDRSQRSHTCSSVGDDSALAAAAEAIASSASRKNSAFLDSSSSSDVSLSVMVEVTERLKRSCGLQETIGRFSRRGSSTLNTASKAAAGTSGGSNRPSVSSTEDLTATPFRSFDSNLSAGTSDKECGGAGDELSAVAVGCTSSGPHSRRRSITALISGRKPSAGNTTPVIINVSTVGEQSEQKGVQQQQRQQQQQQQQQQQAQLMQPSSPSVKSSAEASTGENLGGAIAARDSASHSASGSTAPNRKKKHSKTAVAAGGHQLSKSESVEVKKEKSNFVGVPSGSAEAAAESREESADGGTSPNEICPWENEENCNVKTSNYTKFYETLGYL